MAFNEGIAGLANRVCPIYNDHPPKCTKKGDVSDFVSL